MRIAVRDPAKLRRYRFGLKTADFLLCSDCGVYIGALLEDGGKAWFTVNVNSFQAKPALDFPYGSARFRRRGCAHAHRTAQGTLDAGDGIQNMSKALVVIDVQMGMFEDPASQPFEGEAVVDRIADLIAKARKAGTPVFFVQHDGGPGDSFGAGKPGFPFHDKLAPQPGDDVTVKTKSSAFHGTDLDAKLKRAGIDRLVITGMQSEYCVTSAIRGAYERGYRLTLVSDAHSTFDTRFAKGHDIVAIINDTTSGSFAITANASEIDF